MGIVSAFDNSPFEKKSLNFLHLYELGKIFNLLKPQFLICKVGIVIILT